MGRRPEPLGAFRLMRRRTRLRPWSRRGCRRAQFLTRHRQRASPRQSPRRRIFYRYGQGRRTWRLPEYCRYSWRRN